MLDKTKYSADLQDIEDALSSQILNAFKFSLNQPTGDFFYDPWVIKDELKGTAWERLLNTLPKDIGEARLITLVPGQCYQSHADIDDRYHLNMAGEHGYLLDLENKTMEHLVRDGVWYLFRTDRLHSAGNFGTSDRHQLVVRKLLNRNNLEDAVRIRLFTNLPPDDARFAFDNLISKYLNQANMNGTISRFSYDKEVEFDIERSALETLVRYLNGKFVVKIL